MAAGGRNAQRSEIGQRPDFAVDERVGLDVGSDGDVRRSRRRRRARVMLVDALDVLVAELKRAER